MKNLKIYKVMMILTIVIALMIPQKVYGIDNSNDKVLVPESSLSNEEVKGMNDLYKYITDMKSEYEIMSDLNPKTYIENVMKSGESGLNIKDITKYFLKYITREVGSTFQFLLVLIVVALLSSLLQNLQEAFKTGEVSNIAYFACYAIIVVIMTKSFLLGVNLGKDTIFRIKEFMNALVPILIMLLASMGAFTQAALMDPIIVFISNIGVTFICNIIFPLILISFVLNFVNNLCEESKVEKLGKLIKGGVLWAQGTLMTVFVTFLTIRGVTAKGLDEFTIKTAKFAVDTFIPVVGGCLSDAVSTVAGYTGLVKNAVGTLGLVMIIIIGIFPIIKLAIMAIAYKFTAAVIEPISNKKIVSCISSAGDSLGLIIASVVCVSVMCFIMICIVLSTTATMSSLG